MVNQGFNRDIWPAWPTARWTSDVVLKSYGNQGQRGSIILYLSKNADPLPFRNQRGGGFMNGWTSQTDRAFYQMQYLTGQDTDEVKMVIGNSHSSGIFSLTVTRWNLYISADVKYWLHKASCFGCFVISWLVNKALNLVTTLTQFIFLIVPITIGLLWYVDIITMDSTGIRYRHDRLSFKYFVVFVTELFNIWNVIGTHMKDLSAIWAS